MTETSANGDEARPLRQEDLDAARSAGAAGARTVTARGDVIATAAERTVDALVSAVMQGKLVQHVRGWGRVVGRNIARELIAKPRRLCIDDTAAPAKDASTLQGAEPGVTERLASLLADKRVVLTSRQRQVLSALDPNRSVKANAASVGMTPFSLRRMLRSVKRRLGARARPDRQSGG